MELTPEINNFFAIFLYVKQNVTIIFHFKDQFQIYFVYTDVLQVSLGFKINKHSTTFNNKVKCHQSVGKSCDYC